jgi:hypothetical protein
MKMEKTEWIVVFKDNMEDEFKIEVSSEWLKETLKNWATQDAKDVESDKENYISGRTEHLYENLEEDKYFATEIYDIAFEENKILNSKEILV